MQDIYSHKNISYPVVLFDGVCNLCSVSVQFILTFNHKQDLLFASLQSDFAKQILADHRLEHNLETVLIIEDQQLYKKSEAVFQISKHLGYPWKVIYYFRYIPKFLSDWIYLRIANNRYTLFGKKTECMIPKAKWKHRFLG